MKTFFEFLSRPFDITDHWHDSVLTLVVCGMAGALGFATLSFLIERSLEIGFAERLFIGCVVYWVLVAVVTTISLVNSIVGRTLFYMIKRNDRTTRFQKNEQDYMTLPLQFGVKGCNKTTPPFHNKSPNFSN